MKQRSDYYEQIQQQEENSHKISEEIDSVFVHTRPKSSHCTVCPKCGKQMEIRIHKDTITWVCDNICGYCFNEKRETQEKTGKYYER